MITLDTNTSDYVQPMEMSNTKAFEMEGYPRIYTNMYWQGQTDRPVLPTDSSLAERNGDLRIRDDGHRLAAPGHDSGESDYHHQRSPSPSIRSTLSSESDRGWHYYQYSRHRYPSSMAHGSETAASSSSSRSHRRHARHHLSLDLSKQRRIRGESQAWRDDGERKSPSDKIVLPPLSSLLEGANLLHRSSPDYARWRPSGRASLSSSETASIASERFRRRLSPPVPPQRSSSIAEQYETFASNQESKHMMAGSPSVFLPSSASREMYPQQSRLSIPEQSSGPAKIISGLSAISMHSPDQGNQSYHPGRYSEDSPRQNAYDQSRHSHSMSYPLALSAIQHHNQHSSQAPSVCFPGQNQNWRYEGIDGKVMSNNSQPGSSAASIKAKRKRATPEQLRVLQEVYKVTAFPTTQQRIDLGRQLHMSSRQVQVWFQNQRQGARARLVDLDVSSTASPKGITQYGLPSSDQGFSYDNDPNSQSTEVQDRQTFQVPVQSPIPSFNQAPANQPQLGISLANEDYDIDEYDEEDVPDLEYEPTMGSAHDIFEPRPQ